MTRRTAPEHCANCGAAIPPRARACPECGADERTGWAESAHDDGLNLPDDDDTAAAHAAFLRERQGERPRSSAQWFWWIVGLLLILVLTLGTLGLF